MVPFHFLLLRAAINMSRPAYSSALTPDRERCRGSSGSRQEETLFPEANLKVAVGRGSLLSSSVPGNLQGSQRRAFEPSMKTERQDVCEPERHGSEVSLKMVSSWNITTLKYGSRV